MSTIKASPSQPTAPRAKRQPRRQLTIKLGSDYHLYLGHGVKRVADYTYEVISGESGRTYIVTFWPDGTTYCRDALLAPCRRRAYADTCSHSDAATLLRNELAGYPRMTWTSGDGAELSFD